MKKILVFICLAVMLTVPFAACAEPTPPPPGAPTVITPTPAVVTPSPGLPPAPVASAPTPTTPAGPATPVTPAPAPVVVPAPAGDPVFTVMDPRGNIMPIPYMGLAPRLDTVVGKKIGVVNMMGGNEAALTTVAPAINAAYPGCEAVYLAMADSKGEAEWAFINSCDAIILGNNY